MFIQTGFASISLMTCKEIRLNFGVPSSIFWVPILTNPTIGCQPGSAWRGGQRLAGAIWFVSAAIHLGSTGRQHRSIFLVRLDQLATVAGVVDPGSISNFSQLAAVSARSYRLPSA
jgi:hypothetical protein